MKKTLFALLIAIILFGGCARRTVYLRIAPPDKKTEIRTESPGVKYIWVEGRWQWNRKKGKHKWIPGHWVKKREGKIWIAGSWERTRRGWIWVESYWK